MSRQPFCCGSFLLFQPLQLPYDKQGNGEGGKNQGEALKAKLQDFRDKMLAIDPSIKKEFESTFPVEDSYPNLHSPLDTENEIK